MSHAQTSTSEKRLPSVSHSVDRGTPMFHHWEILHVGQKVGKKTQHFWGLADFLSGTTETQLWWCQVPADGQIFLKLSGQLQGNKQAANYEGTHMLSRATRTAGLVHFPFEQQRLKESSLNAKGAGAGLGIMKMPHDNIIIMKYLR